MNLRPLNDRIVAQRIEPQAELRGGIVIPDTAKEIPQEARVVAVGPGKLEDGHRHPIDVAVGDRILIGKYAGNEIRLDEVEHVILREDDVLAVVAA